MRCDYCKTAPATHHVRSTVDDDEASCCERCIGEARFLGEDFYGPGVMRITRMRSVAIPTPDESDAAATAEYEGETAAACGVEIYDELTRWEGAEPQDIPPTPDHDYTIDAGGQRWCPTYAPGGSAGPLCPECGFMPPDAMSEGELADRTLLAPGVYR